MKAGTFFLAVVFGVIVGAPGSALATPSMDASAVDLPPAQQVAEGVAPGDVACRDGLVLMLRGDGSPLCVTPASAETLDLMGVATAVEGGAELVVSVTRLSDTFAERDDEIRSVVEAAVALYEEHGDEALGMITAGADAYEDGPYPFAVDIYTTNVVAHGVFKERLGMTSPSLTGSDKPYDQIVKELEETGEIWTFYTIVNPETGEEQTKKSLLILRDTYAFGSGFYPTSLEIDMMASMEVAETAASLFEEYGADALDMIREAAAGYGEDSLYPFVIEIGSETVAVRGVGPDFIEGKVADLTSLSKPIAQIQKESELNGGTWVTLTFLNPATGDGEIKMSWMTVRGNCIFGSGFYPDEYDAKQIKAMMTTDAALATYAAQGKAGFATITALNVDDGSYPFVIDARTAEEIADGSVLDRRGQIVWQPHELRAAVGGAMETLESGQGAWITYVFLNPDTGENQAKMTWVVLHDDYLFGAGFYLHGLDAKVVGAEWAVATTIELYNELGEDVFAVITAMESKSETYPFVQTLDLVMVANGAMADAVGTVMEDAIAPDKSREQILAELAGDGVSWIEYELVNPATDRVEVKRSMLKAHDGYIFGSGYYLGFPVVDFTDAEKQWLADNPVVRVAYDPGWPPYEYLDESGMLAGVAGDKVGMFAAITGSGFVPVDTSSWFESLEHMRAGTADMLAMAEKTEARSEYMDFTEPWLTVPIDIASNAPGRILPEDLHDYRVVTVEGAAVEDWLDREMPDVEYVSAASDLAALRILENGTADVFLDPWAIIEHTAAVNGITGIYNAGALGDEYVISVAYAKGNSVFGSILQKMLDATSDWRGQG